MLIRFGLFIFVLAACRPNIAAQPDAATYTGLRISLFDVSIKKQRSESLTLKLSVANTGRLPVWIGKKNETPPENLVIELDTVNLPPILQGRESLLTDAIRNEKISLQPGEILQGVSLDIKLKTPDTVAALPSDGLSNGQLCPDLVFDTAYIVQYSENTMSLRFIVRNAGTAASGLLGSSGRTEDNLAVNVYFVSGAKLTRGAILADGVFIQKGRETLDGLLLPGQALQGEIEIDLSKRTKFSPNLALELDPFQTVTDCNRSNNTKVIEVAF